MYKRDINVREGELGYFCRSRNWRNFAASKWRKRGALIQEREESRVIDEWRLDESKWSWHRRENAGWKRLRRGLGEITVNGTAKGFPGVPRTFYEFAEHSRSVVSRFSAFQRRTCCGRPTSALSCFFLSPSIFRRSAPSARLSTSIISKLSPVSARAFHLAKRLFFFIRNALDHSSV